MVVVKLILVSTVSKKIAIFPIKVFGKTKLDNKTNDGQKEKFTNDAWRLMVYLQIPSRAI